MKAQHPIAIVSLGAATPEDISMRAYGKLQAADEIYCLGEAAHRIVAALPEGTHLAQRCQILEIPMSRPHRGDPLLRAACHPTARSAG